MRKLILALPCVLAACMPATVSTVETAAQSYQDKIAAACSVAMGIAPLAPSIAPWIVAGCATETAIAKLALDPTSLTWLNGLVAMAKK